MGPAELGVLARPAEAVPRHRSPLAGAPHPPTPIVVPGACDKEMASRYPLSPRPSFKPTAAFTQVSAAETFLPESVF